MHAPHDPNKCIIKLLKYKIHIYLSNTKKITKMNNAGLSNKLKRAIITTFSVCTNNVMLRTTAIH